MITYNIVMWETALSIVDCFFQVSDFSGDLDDSKSTSGGVLCIFESRTFVPIIWMCRKQTSVSNGSIESEAISLMLVREWMESLLSINGMW